MEKLRTVLCFVLITPGPSLAQLPGYGEADQASYSEAAAASAPMSGIDMLRMSVPGNPGQDYPIYAEVPDTSFSCDGPDRTEGGYYADVEAECQPFHVCSVDSNTGGLVKYSFLCPNGTIFNQQNFVCEYWFNVDCASSESFYGLNDNIGEVPEGSLSSSASSPAASNSYASPSVAASSPVGYSAPSEPSYQPPQPPQPPQPEYSAARTGRQRTDKAAPRPGSNPRQSSLRGSAQNSRTRSQNQSARRGKSKQTSGRNTNKRPSTTSNTSRSKSNNRLNEVNVNKRRPKNNRQSVQSKKVVDFNRSQAKSQSSLSPPSSPQKKPESRRSKKLRNKNEKRRGRQEAVATGYLPPLDESFDNSLANYDEYEYEEAPLPTYISNAPNPIESDTGYDAPEKSYGAPASDPPSSYGAPASDPPSSYGAPASDPSSLYGALASDPPSSYGAPASDPTSSYGTPASDPPSSYGAPASDPPSSYGAPASDPPSSYGAPETSYSVPEIASYDELAADIAEVVYQEDELPTYNSGVYSPGSSGGSDSEGERYAAPLAPSIPADSALNQVDVLPSYNNGVYSSGSDSSASGERYAAPLAPYIPADSDINKDDVLPSYNNGVYSGGSSNGPRSGNYVAPALDDSYSGPQDSPNTFSTASDSSASGSYGAPSVSSASASYGSPSVSSSAFTPVSPPASLYEKPVPGSYQDPGADILPEYHRSEISLGLNNKNEVPRIEPFSNDYAEPLYIGTYTASGSDVKPEVVKAPRFPDTGYGVPAGPTLSDYNIKEVSDKGFKSSRSSSYGR